MSRLTQEAKDATAHLRQSHEMEVRVLTEQHAEEMKVYRDQVC